MRKLLSALNVLLLLAPAAPSAAQSPTPIPIETFAETPFFTNPVLSPDGLKVAGKGVIKGKNTVIVSAVDSGSPQFIPIGDAVVDELRWAGSTTLLLTVHVMQKWLDGHKIPVTRLAALDVATGNARILDSKSRGILAGDVLYVAPDGGTALVSSQDDIFSYPSVKRVDLTTGVADVVEKERDGVWTWYADAKGVVRAAVAYSGERWKIWYRENAGDPLRRLPTANEAGDAGAVDGLKFMSGDKQGYIITDTRTGRFAVYRYDFVKGTVGAPVFEHPDVDVSNVIADPDDGSVIGVTYTADRFEVSWLDVKMRGLQDRLERVFPDTEIVIWATGRTSNRVLFWSGSASKPGAFYVFDQAARKVIPIAVPFEKLSAETHATVSPIRYTARDGLTIHGYLTMPRGRPDTARPLIVMPHGGPHVRDTWNFDGNVQFLASRGYAVLQPNFRGSTGYGKAFVEKGYGQWGRAMQDDVDDGVDWLVKSGKVDPKRVCIMGASFGGYAAIWGAIRNPERYRCAVSLAGVTDIPGMLKYDRRLFSAQRYFRDWQKKVSGDGVDLNAVSPVAQAARLKVPLLMAQGEKDTTVPPKQARALLAALKGNATPVESIFYPEADHGLDKREDRIDFYRRLEAFLTRYNPS